MNVSDNINTEFEARVMITENQYSLIKEKYVSQSHNCVHSTNTNYYFDDEKRTLTKNHIVLRARNISNKQFEITLKIKGENGDLEINHQLTSNEFNELIKNNCLNQCNILDELTTRGIDFSVLKIIADLKTDRIGIQYPEYLFVIDKNYYNQKVDFNLEVESTSKNNAISYLKSIISKFGIEYKKDYISKSRRAIYNL